MYLIVSSVLFNSTKNTYRTFSAGKTDDNTNLLKTIQWSLQLARLWIFYIYILDQNSNWW